MARGSLYGRAQTFIAGESLLTSRYLFMKVSAEDTVVVQDTADAFCTGVLQTNVASGKEARVRCEGTTLLIAGETIAVGNYIASDDAGKGAVVTPAVGGTTTLHAIRGYALSAGDADETIEIQLITLLAAS